MFVPSEDVPRVVDQAKISAINQAINEFFKGRDRNAQRNEWFSPSKCCLIPTRLREITNSISVFFRDKKWYAGGVIPEELLYTKRNYRLINNIALLDAVELAYDSIETGRALAKTKYEKDVEIDITLSVLHECEQNNIPQDHIGGLLVLYLELCEKVVLL